MSISISACLRRLAWPVGTGVYRWGLIHAVPLLIQEVAMRLDPNRLLRLGELIRKGSFKKAADCLTITQPALSHSIARMESEVGVRLIDRTPHGVVPTVFGSALLRHEMEIEWQLAEADKQLHQL